MKDGIYKVKPWNIVMFIEKYGITESEPLVTTWTSYMEKNCPKSRQVRIFNDKWNISGEEFPVCEEMFEEGPA